MLTRPIDYSIVQKFEKYCPKLVHAVRRKRHLTRKPHEGLYASQKDLDLDFLSALST